MRYISLCSGIEAASEAFIPLGWKPLAFSEIEPFPCAVLKHRYPDVPNHGDLSKYNWGGYRGKADMVCAGFPCQAFSIAGLRNSLEDARGNLSIIGIRAIKSIQPRWVLLEQVPGVLSAEGNAFGCILAGLSGADEPLMPGTEDGKWRSAGIVSGPEYGLAWRVLNAEFFGVPQRRERIFIIGYLGDWRRAAQVLFEPHGLSGYSSESCQAGQSVAGEIADSAGTDSKPLAFKIRQGKSGGGKGYLGSEDKAFTVATGQDQNIMTVRWQNKNDGLVVDDKSATLKSSGTTTDERSVGAYIVSGQSLSAKPITEPTPTLDTGGAHEQGTPPICMATGQGGAEIMEDKSPTLNCNHEAPILFAAQGRAKYRERESRNTKELYE